MARQVLQSRRGEGLTKSSARDRVDPQATIIDTDLRLCVRDRASSARCAMG